MSRLSTHFSLAIALAIGCLIAQFPGVLAQDSASGSDTKTSPPPDEKVRKTEDQWRRLLTVDQFMVTRLKATEAAFSGQYAQGHYNGTFLCVCCGAELFSFKTKFDSGTGWPSFWQPISKKAVARQWDYSEAEPRVEVMCSRCDAHLGHVFDDGPAPTGLRFCINSVAIKLKPLANNAKPTKSKHKVPKKRAPSTNESQ